MALKKCKTDLKKGIKSGKKDLASYAEELDIDDVKSKLNKASDRLLKVLDSAGDEISDASGRLLADIREKPLRAGLAVLAVGVIAASLIR